jgi:hypothetical protein
LGDEGAKEVVEEDGAVFDRDDEELGFCPS